ncbi:MAG: ABC transporter substrate-binding protein, partial [Alphaproteobacteria bacterium]|nr:ABC transporter substrate-binding protein [Alphaproteobacteria bacterium]
LRARYGDQTPAVNELAMRSYDAFLLWAEAVRRVGTADRMAVIEALESNISMTSPSGTVTIDAPTHHTIQDVYLGEVSGGAFKVLETYREQPPADTAAVCDLVANPADTTMYDINVDL